MVHKFGRMITYLEELLPIKSHDTFITWSYKITWQNETIISPLSQYLQSSKRGSMLTSLDGLLSKNSHEPLITWYFEITCHVKN